jgi:hypothetical protein
MSGKRKANDMSSAEPKEKLSKKAKLKQARERAAQFAQRDKERIESRKAKSPKAKAQTKLAKNEVEEKPVVTMTGTAMAKKSPKNKLTLTERRKIAMENAKEFAARDRAGLESNKKVTGLTTTATYLTPSQQVPVTGASPMEGVEHKQLPSSAVYPSQIPGILPNHQNFGAAIDPNQVAAYERMRQMQYVVMQQQIATQQQQELMQQHVVAAKQTLLPAGQQRLQAAAAAQYQVSGVSPMNMAIPLKFTSSGGNGDPSLLPPDTTVTDGGNVDDNNFVGEMNENDMPPPPPALMAQVSQQVLLNAQNEDVDEVNAVSTEDERQNEGKEDGVIANDNSKVKTRWISKITSVFIVGVAIFSIVLMVPAPAPFSENTLSLPDDTMIPKEPLCFLSSDSEYEEACSNGSGGIQCPKGGVCEGGKLVACENIYQDVSDRGDKCVLDDSFIAMKTALINQLVSHASQICEQSSKPNFKYTTLQKELPPIIVEDGVEDEMILEDESEDLVEALMDEGFIVYERDGLYVGLPEGFKVNLPIYCFLGNIGQWFLQEVGLVLLGILRFATSNLLGFVSTYPKPSGVISFLLFFFIKYRQHRAAKKKRQEDIIRTRKISYKTLEESCGVEHCVSHIRDEIAMALYPDSKKFRRELQKNVWPKIVDDVKRDTRVRKFQTFNKDGKTRDMWQWTAAKKTPSKS